MYTFISRFKGTFFMTVLSFIVLFSGCQKRFPEQNEVVIITNVESFEKIVTSVSGFVTDENNMPVQGATVNAGVKTTTTDAYGYFEIKSVELRKSAAFITVNKVAYFKGIKTWIAAEGKAGFFRIKLLPKSNAGSISGTTGGDVILSGGMKISFPTNAIVNATTGIAYTGVVSVRAQWINPTASDLNNIMPGDLRGKDATGAMKLLTTYGMAAVELTSTTGDLLQIATGKKATLTMPIPSVIIANAPTTIPLWYFDETNGLWKEEGSATKVGNNYVGEVSHFSFWNYDVPANYVLFNCTLKNASGQPIQNATVRISVVSNPLNAANGYTDSSGYVGGAVPNNAQLLLSVYPNYNCSTPIYTQTFSTTNVNISLGVITVPTSTTLASFTGTVTNCAASAVTNGYIIVKEGYVFTRYPLSNLGTYSFSKILCSLPQTIVLIGEDVSNAQQSGSITYTVSNAGANTIPNIQACGVTTQQFINYTINGASYNLTAPSDSFFYSNNLQSSISIEANNNFSSPPLASRVSFRFANQSIASGSAQNLQTFRALQILDSTTTIPTPISVSITEYGAVGQFVSGTFSGLLIGSGAGNPPYNITCNFRIRRTN